MQTLLRLVRLCGSEALGECRYFWGTRRQRANKTPHSDRSTQVRSVPHTRSSVHLSILTCTMPLGTRLALTATLLLALSSVMVTSAGRLACCELLSSL